MSIHRKQTTIARPSQVSGFGFWSGLDVTIEFRPAVENTGIVFVRADLPGNPRIPAQIHHRAQGPRRTTLVHQGCAVELVEHVMSALFCLQIDNCEVWVNRPEIPGCDGSAQPFVAALLDSGRRELDALRAIRKVTETIRVGDEWAWVQAEPIDTNDYHLLYDLDYPNCSAIGEQSYSICITPESYIAEIAAARTFVLESEAQQLRKQGLGRRVEYSDLLVFTEDGPINNSLRFNDECARHKLLDMVGDFALIGADLIGKFTAYRSGHFLNAKMAFALLQQTKSSHPADADAVKKIA